MTIDSYDLNNILFHIVFVNGMVVLTHVPITVVSKKKTYAYTPYSKIAAGLIFIYMQARLPERL